MHSATSAWKNMLIEKSQVSIPRVAILKYLYRFLSFESFVDMVQRQSLAFVHPSVWDDPKELGLLREYISFLLFDIFSNKPDMSKMRKLSSYYISLFITYCQSWTKLEESDALWRIYSHNNCAIRVAIKNSSISNLEKVLIQPVFYTEHPFIFLKQPHNANSLISTKRKIFSHEKEVRLIHYADNLIDEEISQWLNILDEGFERFSSLSFKDKKTSKKKSKDFFHFSRVTIFENIFNNIQPVTYINHSHIPNFIYSVMLHPLAPGWFEETVRRYCELNDIKFLGKSKLYQRDEPWSSKPFSL